MSEREAASLLPFVAGVVEEIGLANRWGEEIVLLGWGKWFVDELTAGQRHALRKVQIVSTIPAGDYSEGRVKFIRSFNKNMECRHVGSKASCTP